MSARNSLFRLWQLLLFLLPLGPLVAQETPTGELVYIVEPGETLSQIALEFDTNEELLAELNELANPSLIFVGQRLRVPVDGLAPPALPPFFPPSRPGRPDFLGAGAMRAPEYVVVSGDTLSHIALVHALPLEDLIAANPGINPELLHVGQSILLPPPVPQFQATDLPSPVLGLELAPQPLVEGRSLRVLLKSAVPTQVSGSFLGRELNFVTSADGSCHLALQGIPLFTAAGRYPLRLDAAADGQSVGFLLELEVSAGPYPQRQIILPEEKLDTLNMVTERLEQGLLEQIATRFTPLRWLEGPALAPLDGPILAAYGTRRTYNNDRNIRTHNGLDHRGQPGAPVRAAAAGQVALADALHIHGQTVMLDHGLGIYTLYAHLSRMDVAVGNYVEAGEPVGLVGSSGRSTGPHLHWELWVGGMPVDPAQWLVTDFLARAESFSCA